MGLLGPMRRWLGEPFSTVTQADPPPDPADRVYEHPSVDAVLPHEETVVWLEDPSRFRYVRESVELSYSRDRKPQRGMGRLVGYSVLRADAPSLYPGTYQRRFWKVQRGDPKAVTSDEAVDPMSVRPGRHSRTVI